jgi:UDP-N-acetylglucosamine 3-dehydrogenase
MPLRAGLVGMGVMGRHHARILSSLAGVDFKGVADPGLDPAGGHPYPVFADLDQLLATGIDYCVVAVPTAMHLEVGLTLAHAGVHALVEKPLANDRESAQRLHEAFADAGLVGGVGHIERFNPAVRQARARIAAGDVGEVYQVATRRQGPFPARIADVGVILDLATHDIDLTAWVAQSRFKAVAAQVSHRSGRPHEDAVTAAGILMQGIVTNHIVNWLSPLKERQAVITGEKATFRIDTLTGDLTMYENGTVPTEWDEVANFRGVSEGNVIRFAFPKPEPLLVEHETFRDALLGLPADIVTMEEGLATVMVASAMIESAASNQTLTLSY